MWLFIAAVALALEVRTSDVSDVVYGQWVDSNGVEQLLDASLPAGQLDAAPTYAGSKEARGQEIFVRLKDWASKHTPKLQVTYDTVIHYRGTAADIASAKAAYVALRAEVEGDFRLRQLPEGRVQHDVVRIAMESVDAVRPISTGLGAMLDARSLAERAMSMTQQQLRYSTPSHDRFRSPLAAIRESSGDCDEKVALFVALMRAQEPTLPMAVILMKGHAFVAIDLHAHPGDETVTVLGQTLVAAEPVGPSKAPIGRIGARSRAALESGAYEAFQVPPL